MKDRVLTMAIGVVALNLAACQAKKKSPEQVRQQDREMIQASLEKEMTLKADRDQLAELRKDVPDATQKQNDELALFLNLMKQGTEHPSMVRQKYQSLMQKRRSTFREKVQRLREDFRKEETRRREDFLRAQKEKREAFSSKKPTSADNRRFFEDQEKERSRFFADERDRRQNFEAELMAQSKDFESYMRERGHEFNEQFRLYSKQFSERPKEGKAVTGESPTALPEGHSNPFDKLKDVPATPLGTEN